MASLRDATTPTTPTTGGPLRVMIGPKGPMMIWPGAGQMARLKARPLQAGLQSSLKARWLDDGQLRACMVHLTVDFDGSFALSSNGLPINGHGKSSIEYGQCLNHTSSIQSTSQQTGTIIKPVQSLCLVHTSGQQTACQQMGTCINVNVDGVGTACVAG